MVQIVKSDTYATEDVGGGVEVRRRVFAGAKVPDHWDVEGKTEQLAEPAAGEVASLYSDEQIEQRATVSEGEGEEANVPRPASSGRKRQSKSEDKD